MDDYNTRVLLSKLPPREACADTTPARADVDGSFELPYCTRGSNPSTAVEAFVREVVEQVEELDMDPVSKSEVESDADSESTSAEPKPTFKFGKKTVQQKPDVGAAVLQIMQQLSDANVQSPVSVGDLKTVALPAALKREKRVYAKLLRCLNGAATPMVTARQLFHAANRERAVAGLELGWGCSEAITTFVGYTCCLLLQSVGVSKDVLPPIKPVPMAFKTKINDAWKAACVLHGWPYKIK